MMKKRPTNYHYLVLALAAGLGCTASTAHADKGWYVSARGGASFLSDSALKESTGVLEALGAEAEFDTGFFVSGSLGFAITNSTGSSHLSLEVEVNHATNDLKRFRALGVEVAGAGDVDSLAVMGNVVVDFLFAGNWRPYVIGGVGTAFLSVDDASVAGVALGDHDDTVFAYQFGGGLGYQITPKAVLSLDYRFFSTEDPDFSGVEAEYERHNIGFGLRFSF